MAQREILQQLLSVTQKFKSHFPAHLNKHNTPTSQQPTIPSIGLSTSYFDSELSRRNVAPQICKIALERAAQLASSYQHSYERLCERLFNTPRGDQNFTETVDHLRSIYESLYHQRDIPRFLADALKAQSAYTKRTFIRHSTPRRPFNHQFTPLLEKYFERNAYPASADRSALAQKTMMTPRQIEVWFQNHRNRAKKDNRPLNRWASSTSISIDSLMNNLPHALSSPESDLSDDDETSGDDDLLYTEDTPEISQDPFFTLTPEHAFPTTYPPNCPEDPFPNYNGIFSFPKPQWGRTCAVTTAKPAPITIDELSSLFASKLNLREASGKRSHDRQSHPNGSWFASRVTVPCRAPLPSLIRSSTPYQTSAATGTSAPVSRPFSASSPRTQLPQQPLNTIRPNPRKVASLPRRTPSVLHPSFTPYSLESSSRRLSRSPSWSSVETSSSRTSSGSSFSSIEPTTPPLSPNSPPVNVIFTEQDFHVLGQLFGRSLEGLPTHDLSHNIGLSSMKTTYPTSTSCTFNLLPHQHIVTHIEARS